MEGRTANPRIESAAPGHGRAWRGLLLSLSMHGAIAAVILGTAWGVARSKDETELPVVLAADFRDPAPSAGSPMRPESDRVSTSDSAPAGAPHSTPDPAIVERLRALERGSAGHPQLDALARRFGATDPEGVTGSATPPRVGATFAGLVAGNATRVAYVVDASGSMVGRFPSIVDEVERSLSRLEPTQSFSIVCFRRDGAVAPEGGAGLRPASRAARADAVRWLREGVVPSGRSSPVEALALALRSGADCIFLLSSTVTGPASHELDRDSLLALLEKLNPRDPATGLRRATIQCIQFLEPDPGGALEAVAAEHFGPGGFRFIPRAESSIDAAGAPARDTPPQSPRRP